MHLGLLDDFVCCIGSIYPWYPARLMGLDETKQRCFH